MGENKPESVRTLFFVMRVWNLHPKKISRKS